MGVSDWNWRAPVELQDVPWDCAAASTAWCLQSLGLQYTEYEVVVGLGPTRISPTFGLLDASGAGIVSWLGEIGIEAWNNDSATWDEVVAAAGYQPMLIGGRAWCHWTGVRMGSNAAQLPATFPIALANPAPGWMGVHQVLEELQFAQLGPFSAVWLEIP